MSYKSLANITFEQAKQMVQMQNNFASLMEQATEFINELSKDYNNYMKLVKYIIDVNKQEEYITNMKTFDVAIKPLGFSPCDWVKL